MSRELGDERNEEEDNQWEAVARSPVWLEQLGKPAEAP